MFPELGIVTVPDIMMKLYVGPSTRRTLKYEWVVRGFDPPNFTFSTISHELHRSRRGAVAPFFSKALVQQLKSSVETMIQKLVKRLDKLNGTGTVINLIDMYPGLTSDISKATSGATTSYILFDLEMKYLLEFCVRLYEC